MRIGLQVPDFTFPDGPASIGPTLGRVARGAEAIGMESFWVMDHFFQIQMLGPPEREMLEGYTTLGFVAGQTSTISLGTLVTGVTYRHPGILLKTVTTLDVLSGGRAWLGIGAAWNEEEHRGLGVPYPGLGTRFELLEETLQIAHQMFRADESAHEGKHYQLKRPLNSPQPLRSPHPPIMVGGSGEKKTLRLVAQYADACNIFDMGPARVAAKYAVLDRHCAEIGRNPKEITRTVLSRLPSDPGEAVEHLGKLAEIGTDAVLTGLPDISDPVALERLGPVVEQVAKL